MKVIVKEDRKQKVAALRYLYREGYIARPVVSETEAVKWGKSLITPTEKAKQVAASIGLKFVRAIYEKYVVDAVVNGCVDLSHYEDRSGYKLENACAPDTVQRFRF